MKNPDYIAGPVYPTNAKAIPDKPVGINLLKQVLGIAKIPVVAIGGIFPDNIEEVIDAGARNIAMVRHFMQTNEFDSRVLEINKLLNRIK